MSINAAVKNVGWNTAITVGVAVTTAAVTVAVSKCGHYLFEVKQDIKVTWSALIRLAALGAGVAVGCYSFQKATVVHIALDQTFATSHLFPIIMGLFSMTTAYLLSDAPDKTGTVMYASVGSLALTAPFIAHFGKNALIPAIGIGAAVGAYL